MQASPPSAADQAAAQQHKEQARMARMCFTAIDRLSTLMSGYPANHPVIDRGVEGVKQALDEYFRGNERLSVQVHPHWMTLYGTEEVIWETTDPKDFCFSLTRDGVYLLHLLVGVEVAELRRFIDILNTLVDPKELQANAVTLLFEANLTHMAYDALDESLAALAGMDSNTRERDTAEEQEAVEQLFRVAFDQALQQEKGSQDAASMAESFELRLNAKLEKQHRFHVGSRQFLHLGDDSQNALMELREGFTRSNELEHRQAELLASILGARPKEALRQQTVGQIGKLMSALLQTHEPWDVLHLLRLMHEWRERFAPEVAEELKSEMAACFNTRRIQSLVREVNSPDTARRRGVLQMFNALHLDAASAELARMLGWDLAPEVADDITRYLRERMRFGLDFLTTALPDVPPEKLGPLMGLLVEAMPRSRPALLPLLKGQADGAAKAMVLKALRGSWRELGEIREYLVPLLDTPHPEVRQLALESFAEAAPQHVFRVLEGKVNEKLRGRPDDEVRHLVHTFVTYGGPPALEKLRGLVQRRGVVSEEDIALAVAIAKALMRTPYPPVVELLESISKDLFTAGRIKSTCKEIAELLRAGMNR